MRLVPFLLTHNAESDAVDLLLELESISKIVDYVDANTYQRVCLYMVSMVYYLTPPDDLDFLRTAHEIYKRHKCYTEALTLALRLQDTALIQEDFEAPTNPHMKRQLAYILARQQVNVPTDDEALTEILNNTKLSESFKRFGKELSVTEPKSLEDIYKSHLENTRGPPAQVDSARQNLAGTFVNAFVNAGFGNDKLMVEAEEGQSWIYKNKDHGASYSASNLNVFAAVPEPKNPPLGVNDVQACSVLRHLSVSRCCGTPMSACRTSTSTRTLLKTTSRCVSMPLSSAVHCQRWFSRPARLIRSIDTHRLARCSRTG